MIATKKRGRPKQDIDLDQLITARLEVLATRKKLRTWEAVASYYGISRAAAHRIGTDKTYRPSQKVIDVILCATIVLGDKKKHRRQRPPAWRPMLSLKLKAEADRLQVSAEELMWYAIVRIDEENLGSDAE